MPSPFAPNMLRMNSLFPANDLPQQGGFAGNMPPIDFGGMPMQATDMGEGSPVFSSFGPSTDMPDPMGGGFDVDARMKELYNPSTEATDRFNNMVGGMPQYEKPGIWRTIAAALSAFGPGGHETGMAVANEPYQRKLTDWKNQIGPAQQAASLERQENVNSRTLAYQQVSNELRARADEHKARNDEKNALIRQQRADIYEFKARNPTYKLVFPKGGNIQAINPQDPSQVIDLKIPTGTLTETDKINMSQEDAIERIEATGGQQRQTEGVRQQGREKIAGMPARSRPTGSVTAPEKKMSPAQTRTEQSNNAQKLVNTRPDLAPFVTVQPGGRFMVKPPSEGGFFGDKGPSKAQYDEIRQLIYGDAPAISQPTRTGRMDNPTPANDTNPTPNQPKGITDPTRPGKIKVINSEGRAGWIPQTQLQDALQQGYTLAGK